MGFYSEFHSHTHTDARTSIRSAGLALLCMFVGVVVCTHLLGVCQCVCVRVRVISVRQATALKGARLQTLHWDETPATGLRPEP